MAQIPERPCPNCGIMVPTNQRFCTNCGTAMEGSQPSSQGAYRPQQQPYPPYSQYPPQAGQQVPPYAQGQQQSPVGEAVGALGALWLLRRQQSRASRRRSSGFCGCLVTLIVLAIIGGVIYSAGKSVGISNLNKVINSTSSIKTLATQPPITTNQINQTVTYAGVDITILNAEQSQAFLDDSYSNTNGMVRLNIREHSNTSRAFYAYDDVAHLLLPDGSSVAAINEQQTSNPQQGVIRTNWLDFPLPTSNKISQLTLRLGKDTQAQIDIPLTGKADLTKYQAKTVNPNVSTQYAGLDWTVISATSSLSASGQQADKGMQYVTVTLKVDNPSSNYFTAYWGDYIRLKSAETTSAPTTDSTLPTGFAAGSSGQKGDLTFLMSQGSSAYTLIFLQRSSANQSTADFRL